MEENQKVHAEQETGTQGEKTAKKATFIQFLKRRWILLVCIIAAVGILATAIGIIFHVKSPEYIAEQYAEALFFGDLTKERQYRVYDVYASWLDGMDEEEFFELESDLYKEDITSWEELSAYRRALNEEDLLDEYGEYTITFEATRSKDISLRKLANDYASLLNSLEADGLIDRSEFTDAKVVTIKVKIEGEDGIERMTRSAIMVKVNDWKVLKLD